MDIKLYINNSSNNVLNKSLSNESIKSCEIYNEIDVVSPIIFLNGYVNEAYNYVYIPSFNRYYYITNIRYINGYTYIDLNVDVLMSYRSQLKNENVYVERNEKKIDDYRRDTLIPTLAPTRFRIKKFPNSFSSGDNMILVVNGGN